MTSSHAGQQESASSRVNTCEASFECSVIVRYGADVVARSSTVSPNFTAAITASEISRSSKGAIRLARRH